MCQYWNILLKILCVVFAKKVLIEELVKFEKQIFYECKPAFLEPDS